MMSNINQCDFCKSKKLSKIYKAHDSVINADIMICSSCGLVQSLFKNKKNKKELVITTSSGANWGNIRHGKGLRFEKSLYLLKKIFDKEKICEIIDIGSNRGDFVIWVNNNYSKIKITGIEPDQRIVNSYKNLKNFKLYRDRLENLNLPVNKFDFVYCSHTLEHANSASEMLKKIYQITKINGFVFLEIPNMEIINEEDVVEEFFIDKHTFHFNRSILIKYLEYLGFKIIEGQDSEDVSNITLVLKKTNNKINLENFVNYDKKLVKYNKLLIKKYNTTLIKNRNKLVLLSKKLYEFTKRQKVILWGGGRIFDALVVYGGFKTDKVIGVIDKYLSKLLPKVHDIDLKGPEFLRFSAPDVVIILAKSSVEEIEKEVRSYGVRHVIKFNDLINSVS